MAVVLGRSGALATVLKAVAQLGIRLDVESLADLRVAGARAKRRAASRPADMVPDIENELEQAAPQLAKMEHWTKEQISGLTIEHDRQIERISSNALDVILGALSLAFCFPLVLIPLVHWASRSSRRARLGREHNRACNDLREALRREMRRIDAVRSDPLQAARNRLARAQADYEQIADVLASPEARGAHGEVKVIETLRRLPDDYHVINDLRLKATHFMRYDGDAVQTAQIDHAVVGPTGIFVIETKAWSVAFAESGRAFDPCKQVARAGLLCHVLLKEAGLPCRVTNVIARNARLPDSPHMRRVTLRSVDELPETIRRWRARLTHAEVMKVTEYLWQSFGGEAG